MKKIISTPLLMVLSTTLLACSTTPPTEVNFELTDLGSEVCFLTESQKAFMDAEYSLDYIEEHEKDLGRYSNSYPNAVKLSWTAKADNGAKPKNYIVKLTDEDGEIITTKTKRSETNVSIYNLKINMSYTWTVEANYGKSATFISEAATFKTSEQGPRNIYVPGMENVRDLGGYNVGENKIFKQGLIYRSAELNGDKEGVSKPTKEGKRILLEDLHIKSELDLRRTTSFEVQNVVSKDEVCGITSSPLGDTVSYQQFPMYFGHTNIFDREDNKPSIKAFFEYCADENNYPMMFHCVRGTDRTGALAYVIGAMCGMNEEDLMKDYLFSNFANINSDPIKPSDISKRGFYIYQIKQEDGDTFAIKTMNYLKNMAGVSQETLDRIVSILVKTK